MNLSADPGGRRYTRDEMCRIASEHGHVANARLLTEWVQLGLLDRPARKGLGRGLGQLPGTWPEDQLQLFLMLLNHRGDVSRKKLAGLTNYPVWVWLMWGDKFVPLRQVRLALGTWAGWSAAGARLRGEATARSLLRGINTPGIPAASRQAFIKAVGRMSYTGKFDRKRLEPLVIAVLDPRGTGAPIGPPGAQLTPDVYLDVLEARYTVVRLLTGKPEDGLTDQEFYSAQEWYRIAWEGYAREQPMFAKDPVIGGMFKEPSGEAMLNSACENLVSILGIQRMKSADPG